VRLSDVLRATADYSEDEELLLEAADLIEDLEEQIAALRIANNNLIAELRDSRAARDAARLDWAETHPVDAMREISIRWHTAGPGFREKEFYFRRAIDAAREQAND
jgi:hypothetical protein